MKMKLVNCVGLGKQTKSRIKTVLYNYILYLHIMPRNRFVDQLEVYGVDE